MSAFYLLLLSSFYFIYFSKQLTARFQGIKTNQLGKGNKTPKERLTELSLLFISIIAAVAQFAAYFIPQTFPDLVTFLGLIVMLSSVIIFFMSIYRMKNNWRAGISKDKTELVTTGIYSFSRNPAFLAFDLLYWGSWLATGNLLLLALSAIGSIIFHLQILQEEQSLLRQFGETYSDYKKKTPRYIKF